MDLKEILELLGQEHLPSDEMTGGFLDDAVAGFAANPAGATTAIRRLQASDPSGFVLAAVRLLTTREEKSPGMQYVAALMFSGDLLIDALIDKRLLALEAATALARNLATAEPLLDSRMISKMLANAGGDIRAVDVQGCLRVLSLVETISDCSHLSTYLVQLMRHPSAHLQSKAALLLGRANLNLSRTKQHLTSEDMRIRANAVEALWGWKDPQIVALLREALKDKHPRVTTNALVGLCKTGDREAVERLKLLSSSLDKSVRANAAWAMGALKDPLFDPFLAALEQDPDSKVRALAAKSRKAMPVPAPPEESSGAAMPASPSTVPENTVPGNTMPRNTLSGNAAAQGGAPRPSQASS
jgi:hypothetical protein